MTHTKKHFLTICLIALPLSASAHMIKVRKTKKESNWSGSAAKIGIINNTGNTNTLTTNLSLIADYSLKQWNNVTQVKWQYGRSEGTTNKEKLEIRNQLDYLLLNDHNQFLFLINRFVNDHYSPFDYQLTNALGFGHTFIKNDRLTINAQVGPGLRLDRLDKSNASRPAGLDTKLIGYTAAALKWQVFPNLAFQQELQYDIASDYNYVRTLSSISNSITQHVSLQVSFQLEYYSNIPVGSTETKKLDTTTDISAVYNF